jgi:nitrogenase molybdenum-iron protein alpha/beta subunit
VSGSVVHISEKFFNIINTLNDDKYEKEIYAFATEIVPVKRKGSSYTYHGAGYDNDMYKLIKHFDEKVEKNKPDLVIVLTDGYYQNISNLTEKKYSNWNFFFTIPNMNNCPKNSKKTIIEGMIR